MKAFMKDWVVPCCAVVLATLGILWATTKITGASNPRPDEAGVAVAELVATTPEGVRLYRVQTPKTIVPTFIAVSPNNHSVSVR